MKILKSLSIVIFLGIITSFFGCNSTKNTVENEQVKKTNHLEGMISKDQFLEAPHVAWFKENYNGFTIKKKYIEQLMPLLKDVKIVCFLGSWCEDSQFLVPEFYKLLDMVSFDENDLTTIAVQRGFGENIAEEFKAYHIERVPTFIFYRNNKEIGRIVEYPEPSLEKQMISILKRK